MNAHEPDLEYTPTPDRETRHLAGSGADLEQLSISELEALLAERRRRESKRMLRVIAGRATNEAPTPPRARTTGLSGGETPARKGRITRRLLAEEVRLALGRPTPARWTMPPPTTDRFRRSGLAATTRPPAQHGPAWMRQATVRKTVDLGLQLAEVSFVLLFLYVVAQWLFADAQTDTNIADEMAGVLAPVATPARPGPPLASRPAAQPGTEVPDPVVHSWALGTGRSAAAPTVIASATGRDPLDNTLLRNLAPVIPAPILAPLTGTLPLTQTATLSQTTATITDSQSGTMGTPAPADDAVVSDPALTTEIRIPKIKLDARVREVEVDLTKWEWEVADYMAGHHTGTANPGDQGNVVIAGHRDIRGSVFLHLDQLKKGDDIYLYSGRGIYHYVVRAVKIVLPTAVEVMAPTTDSRLTLITCTPVKIASHRLIIIADLDTNYVAPARGN
jgi:LPXTG-site transpeptidase (sortase) family protein